MLPASAPPVSTVFFGGGTPTLLPAEHLGLMLAEIGAEFGLAPDAEVTTEANPESVTPAYLAKLRAAGFTRHLARHAVGGQPRAGGAGAPAPAGTGPSRRWPRPGRPASSTSTWT